MEVAAASTHRITSEQYKYLKIDRMSKFGTLEILPGRDAGMNECDDSGWMKGVLFGV